MLAEVHHFIPLEEMTQPVWRLPAGVRTAAIILSLAGLVGGVRVLDAQIANKDVIPPPAEAGVSVPHVAPGENPPAAPLPTAQEDPSAPPTAVIVDKVPVGDTHTFISVTVTGYSIDSATTASSRPVRPGTVALSRDLLRNFTPGAPYAFGDRILIPGMGMYIVEDAMNPRWTRKADIWFGDDETARRWGVRNVYITEVSAGEPLLVTPSWNH
jgi:3D (Asp-Asp-Asp) domain-containing protein